LLPFKILVLVHGVLTLYQMTTMARTTVLSPGTRQSCISLGCVAAHRDSANAPGSATPLQSDQVAQLSSSHPKIHKTLLDLNEMNADWQGSGHYKVDLNLLPHGLGLTHNIGFHKCSP
jgi:hypothetical protein